MRRKPTWIPRIAFILIALSSISLAAGAEQDTNKKRYKPGSPAPSQLVVPGIDPSSDERIDLLFAEPASVLDIYRALGKAWGVNMLFDPKLRDQEITVELVGITALAGFESILRTVGHFYSVVGPDAVLIAQDTPQNRRTYEHQVVQKFYLENAEVRDVMTLVRSLVGAKHVAANERNNSLVIRDTADKASLIEELVRRNDRPQAEVVVAVDLLTVDPRELRGLGLRPAKETLPASDGVPARLAAGELDRLLQQSSTRRLAQPEIDVVDGSVGKLRLTDRLPVPSPAESQGRGQEYHEVGVKVEVVPRVHSGEEVTLEVAVAVESLTGWLYDPGATGSGEARPMFGQRDLDSSARLGQGETYLLSGVMEAPEDTEAASRYLGRFQREVAAGREVILALTPHIVRGPAVDASDLEPIWIGTEANIATHGNVLRAASPISGPFGQASFEASSSIHWPVPEQSDLEAQDEAAREEVRERLRERLRDLEQGEVDQAP